MNGPGDIMRDAFHKAGRRMTAQRRLILEALEASEGHPDAETLHDLVKARDATISLATVYRTLAVLKEMGLVEEHRLGESHGHYEAIRGRPHYHFSCLNCGEVIEFDAPELEEVVHRLIRQKGVRVVAARLNLSGYCLHCQKGEEAV